MEQEQLNEIVRLHGLWLQKSPDGKRADLSNTDLSNTNLSYTDLSHAKMNAANLSNTNLSYTDLSNTDLNGANLRGAIVETHYDVGLINFSGGSQGRLSVYDAKNDVVHCGCWSGTLYEFVKMVNIQYKSGFERKSYLLEILKLRAFKQHYKSLTNN